MSGVNDQVEAVVLPALAEYTEAEQGLTDAVVHGKGDAAAARALVMRRARSAAIELHQFADFVAAETGQKIDAVRPVVAARCVFHRGGVAVDDIALLRDVADAFKHQKLDRTNARVTGSSAVIASATGYSVLYFGEGKFGGVEAVIVTTKAGKQRALSSILQNTADAWRAHLNRAMPDIGDYSA